MISIVAGAGAAIALAESQWRGRDVVETLFLSPKFVPTVVIGFSISGFCICDPCLRCVHPAGHGARRDHHPVHGSGDACEPRGHSAAVSVKLRVARRVALARVRRRDASLGAHRHHRRWADGVCLELRRGGRKHIPDRCLHADPAYRVGGGDACQSQSRRSPPSPRCSRRWRSSSCLFWIVQPASIMSSAGACIEDEAGRTSD